MLASVRDGGSPMTATANGAGVPSPAGDDVLLEVRHLVQEFVLRDYGGAKGGVLQAVSDVSFKLQAGETLGIVAFVTVSLGGFGSVPGALVAGLLIGVIESLSAYWIGAVYKDIVVYSLFLCFLWFRPQGLMGKS